MSPQIAKHLLDGKLIDIALWNPKHTAFRIYADKFVQFHGTTLLPSPSPIMDTLKFVVPDAVEWVKNTPFPGKPFTVNYHEMLLNLILMDEYAYRVETENVDYKADRESILSGAEKRYRDYTVRLQFKLS